MTVVKKNLLRKKWWRRQYEKQKKNAWIRIKLRQISRSGSKYTEIYLFWQQIIRIYRYQNCINGSETLIPAIWPENKDIPHPAPAVAAPAPQLGPDRPLSPPEHRAQKYSQQDHNNRWCGSGSASWETFLETDPGGNKLTGNQLNKSRKLEEKNK